MTFLVACSLNLKIGLIFLGLCTVAYTVARFIILTKLWLKQQVTFSDNFVSYTELTNKIKLIDVSLTDSTELDHILNETYHSSERVFNATTGANKTLTALISTLSLKGYLITAIILLLTGIVYPSTSQLTSIYSQETPTIIKVK